MQTADLRDQAEGRLQSQRYIPTQRGRILDRKGRVLAADRPSYDIAVDYPVITGQWAFAKAAQLARQIHKARWGELNPAQREALIEEQLPQFQEALSQGWAAIARTAGVSAEELEERRNEIIAGVHRAQANVQENERQRLERVRREEAMQRGQEIAVEVSSSEVSVKIREQVIPHVILRGLADDAAFKFIAMAEGAGSGPAIPGLHVIDSAGREYPNDRASVVLDRSRLPGPLRSAGRETIEVTGVATHVVGWMRPTVYPEDLAARGQAQIDRPARSADGSPDLGFYMLGDRVGAAGVERSCEMTMRGQRGVETEQLDTGEILRVNHRAGGDVRLTLDISLQARIQALLDPRAGLAVVQPWHTNKTLVANPHARGADDALVPIPLGTPLAAAAVVLDIDTSEILALVTSPTFSREELGDQVEKSFEDQVAAPFKNRAIGEAYPPGSIVKPIVYASAVAAGVIEPNHRIACNGFLFQEHPDQFRCWIMKQFKTSHSAQLGGELSASDALMVSCNIYFYTMGRMMGPDRMMEWYNRFGLGRSTKGQPVLHPELGIGIQYDGAAGDPKGRDHTSLGEATLMGIGQGPVAWTPLHAVDAYATLARGGVRILPKLRADLPTAQGAVQDLHLDPRTIPVLLDGLHRAIADERGSGHHITWADEAGQPQREVIFAPPPSPASAGVMVWGKSGTADAPRTVARDTDEEGESYVVRDAAGKPRVLRQGDHSWFVGMVGPTDGTREARPRYAIAVVVEYGGSGGKVSGPIANQIIYALMDEGYLPEAAPPLAPPQVKPAAAPQAGSSSPGARHS